MNAKDKSKCLFNNFEVSVFFGTKAYFGRKRDGMHGLVPRKADAYRFATIEEAEAKARQRLDFFPNGLWGIKILVNPRPKF